MTKLAGLGVRILALLAVALIASGHAVPAAGQTGTFAAISDIHFNPFDPPELGPALATTKIEDWPSRFRAFPGAMAHHGEDTNYPLFASALAAFSDRTADVDLVIVAGDFLAHRFEYKAAEALSASERSAAARALAQRTTLFVADALAKAMPGKPVFLTLGNNDSDCGDYEIEPGGGYLAATRETVRRLAGADRVAADFDQTYAAGGYYAARHPTLPDTLILVLNDVLWSAKYRDACGSDGLAAGQAMMGWLRDRLAQQKSAGGKVWVVHHIPWGIDPYATLTAKGSTCPARVVPFLNEAFAGKLGDLLRAHADTITFSLSGHIHFDSYRLIVDDQAKAIGVDKLVPAISPIFGQNPGFQLFTYDLQSGAASDFSTIYLANLAEASSSVPGDWRLEYTFTQAYGQKRFAAPAVDAIWKALSEPGTVSDTFRRLYNVSRGDLDAGTLPAYRCAIGHLDPKSFTACYCGN